MTLKIDVSEFFLMYENEFLQKISSAQQLDPRDKEFQEILNDANKCVSLKFSNLLAQADDL